VMSRYSTSATKDGPTHVAFIAVTVQLIADRFSGFSPYPYTWVHPREKR
jgi:hypothetical protein